MADARVIETRGLRKTYGGVEALRGLDLAVSAGSVAGLLGRNGAGKTTAIKILLGIVVPTSGDVRVFGDRPSPESRRRIGFVSEEKDLYPYMTGDEMIRFTASFYPRWRDDLAQQYARRFALPLDRKVKHLSRGMRTRLALLLAFCRGAELLIVDEPTAGLDAAATDEVLHALVAHAAADGAAVLIASHDLRDIDQIADHLTIIDNGRAVVSGELDDLRERFCRIHFVFEDTAPAMSFRTPGITRIERRGRILSVVSSEGADDIVNEARALRPVSVDVEPVTLKDIFLAAVAKEE